VTDGETDPYLQYTKHIAARYFLKGDEDNSLGVVRGVTAAEDETDDNPLVVRLAGVDAKPAAHRSGRSPARLRLFQRRTLGTVRD